MTQSDLCFLRIGRMEQLVRLVSARFTKELFINPDDRWVLVRFPVFLTGVLTVKGFCSLGTDVHFHFPFCGDNGLSAAVDTAARAGHELDEMIILVFTVLNAFHHLADVGATAGNRYLHGQIRGYFHFCGLKTIDAADGLLVNFLNILVV